MASSYHPVCGEIPLSQVTATIRSMIKHRDGPNFVLKVTYEDFRKRLRDHVQRTAQPSEESFYCLLRLFCPDRDYVNYGIDKAQLAKIVVDECLALKNSNCEEVRGLRKDLTAKSEAYFTKRQHGTLKANIARFHELLTEFASRTISGKAHVVRKAMDEFNGDELTLWFHVILKVKDSRIANCRIRIDLNKVVPGLDDLIRSSNSLELACKQLVAASSSNSNASNSNSLPRACVKAGCFVKPMLASPHDRENIRQLGDEFFVETKYDGERLQVHLTFGESPELSCCFTRNGHDCSDYFGDMLIALRRSVQDPNCKSIVLDGEIMLYDMHGGGLRYKSKAVNDTIRTKKLKSGFCHAFCIFDILLFNGCEMISSPLVARREKLNDVIRPDGVHVHLSEQQVAKDEEDIGNLFNISRRENKEGLMLKNKASTYSPDSRQGGWWKLKSDYTELADTVDCLILGVTPKQQHSRYCEFICGVATDDPGKFKATVKLSKLSEANLKDIDATLSRAYCSTSKNPPHFTLDERFHQWVAASDSIVLEVKCADVLPPEATVRSKNLYHLRFPRLVALRRDKSYQQVTTTKQLEKLIRLSHGSERRKAVTALSGDEEEEKTVPTKRKASAANRTTMEKNARSDTNTSSNNGHNFPQIFTGKSFWFAKTADLNNFSTFVKNSGGSIDLHSYSKNTDFLISDDKFIDKVKTVRERGQQDVLLPTWLNACESAARFIEPKRDAYLIMSSMTENRMDRKMDPFGYDLDHKITGDEINKIVSSIDVAGLSDNKVDNLLAGYNSMEAEMCDRDGVISFLESD